MVNSRLPKHHDTLVIPSEIRGDRFVADVLLDSWTRRGRARRVGGVLWLDDERIHDVVDAVRVLGRRGGESDRFGWTGRVFSLRELLRLGASVGPLGVTLGAASYDVEFGVLLEADDTVSVADRVTSSPARPSTSGSGSHAAVPTSAASGGLERDVASRAPSSTAPAKPSYGTSPGRYSASGGFDAAVVHEGGYRLPSGTHRRVEG